MAIVKDLGMVTAYAYAVAGGYEGTEAEFEQMLGQAGITLEQLENLTAVATTLSEGSEATASYSEGVLTFGIPRGNTGAKGNKGDKGDKGDTGNGIASIAKTGASGLVDTYTITFTDGTTTTFTVTNGADGDITNVAAAFDATKAYSVGDMVLYQGTLYAFTAAHPAGAWVGSDAQAVILADEVTELKDDLGAFIYSTTINGTWGHIAIASVMSTSDNILVRPITATDVDYVRLVGKNANNAEVDIAELTVGEWSQVTLTQNYTSVEVLYHLTSFHAGDTYQAACFFSDNGGSLANALTHVYDYAKAIGVEADGLYVSAQTPFVDPVPVGMRGIMDFKIIESPDSTPLSSSTDYRVVNFYYKSSGFYFYLQLQRKVADTWYSLGSVLILTADAPTETANMIFTATNGAFQVAVNTTLLSSGSYGNVNARINPVHTKPFLTDMQNQVNTLTSELQYGDYEDQDTIKHVVHVDPSGNGDYTTIAAAYAAITDSSYVNQYEVILHDGTYNEYNLICPPYTHTHGYNWKSCIVTSEGVTSTLPVFDQKSFPSKLSNMTIISGTGYCIHNDYNFIATGAVYNENLYCKKVYASDPSDFAWKSFVNTAIIGAGAQYKGVKIIYNNCTFEDGAVVCHSNSAATEEGNFHFVLKNCKVVNAYIQLNMAGNTGAAEQGLWICEINGLIAPVGCPALVTKIGERKNNATWFGWQIVGGNNHNFAVKLDNADDMLTTVIPWDNINTNEKILVHVAESVTAGQLIDDTFSVCDAEASGHDVCGVVLADGASGDTVPVWVGNAYSYTASDGEYGIGSNGALSSSATEKIGKVVRNIFYRY